MRTLGDCVIMKLCLNYSVILWIEVKQVIVCIEGCMR